MLKGSGALLFAVLAGCGGRSSTLEPDAITGDANQPSGGSTSSDGAASSGAKTGVGATGSATGGKAGSAAGSPPTSTPGTGGAAGGSASGGSPAGGAASAGAAGSTPSGGASGISSSLATACKNYCLGTTQGACPQDLGPFDECMASCSNEVSGQSPSCQKTAEELLGCLLKAYQNSSTCNEYEYLSTVKCAELGKAYALCNGSSAPPPPVPTPMPAQSCSSSGSSGNGSCFVSVKCDTGAYYSVSCTQSGPAQSNCTCNASLPNGSGSGASFGLNESTTFACYDSLATCGFPQIDPK